MDTNIKMLLRKEDLRISGVLEMTETTSTF